MTRFPNISEASSIAIHSLALIDQSDEALNVNRIAGLTQFSKNHISKVLQTLVHHGYLSSGRGPKGGFISNMEPERVSLLEVIELIEGRMSDMHCGIDEGKCPFKTCVFGDLPLEFKKRFREYYKTRHIGDLNLAKPVSELVGSLDGVAGTAVHN
jgi:Rrf2 family protein